MFMPYFESATRRCCFPVLLGVVLCLTPCSLQAQLSGATLNGQISDGQGAIIPGAKLDVRNNATGVLHSVTSNNSGQYSIPDLQPGIYTVVVTDQGFSTFTERNLQLNVGTTRNLDVALTVGSVAQQVEVSAAEGDVEIDTSVVSATVGQRRIVDLPLNGRDWTQLATLQPGVNNTRTQFSGTALGSNRAIRGFGNTLVINGHSAYENTYRIDGINENDESNGAPGSPAGVNLGVDAIQEFSVVTTAYTAEYGRTSGGVINAVTRSGTNQVHGTAFVFDRDKIFDARNPFDAAVIPSFRRLQFGGAAGGPIRKDKTFLFGNYEGLRQTLSENLSDFVPSAAARTGLLHNPSTGAPVQVTIDPQVAPFLALYPAANGPVNAGTFGDTAAYNTTGQLKIKENFVTTRFDQNFSQKDTLSLTYLFDNAPETLPDPLDNYLSTNSVKRQVAAVTERHTFGASVLNVARAGYNRSVENGYVPLQAINPAASNTALGYFSNLNAPLLQITNLTSAGGLGSGRQSVSYYNSYQANDDVALARGRHNIKTGFAFERIQADVSGPLLNGNGTWVATSASTSALQNFLTNHIYAAQVPEAAINPVEPITDLYAGYVQDDWRVRKRLTLNLGLRYEFLTIPVDRRGRLGLINTLNAPLGTGPCPAVVSATTVPGCTVPVPGFFQTNPTTHNFEPRVGFSYDVFGDGKTALRGAFGIYDLLPLPYLYAAYSAATSPYEQDRLPIGTIPAGSFPFAVPGVALAQPATRLGHYIDPNPKRDYSLNYNMNLEQQFSKTVSGSIGYVGFHSVHAPFQSTDINTVAASSVQVIGGRYVFPYQGTAANPIAAPADVKQDANNSDIFGLFFDGSQHYNGLLTQLKVSGYHGLVAQGTYTWQQCIDYGSGQSGTTYTNSIAALIYFDKPQRRGACDYVLTQNFTANAIYELPNPRGEGVLKVAAGGWQIGGIVNVSTGSPFTILQNGDVIGQKDLTFSSFPDQLRNCNSINHAISLGAGGNRQYVNSNCFSFPTTPVGSLIAPLCNTGGTTPVNGQVLCQNVQGNERRNSLIGPRLVDADLSVIKNTRVPRFGEAFNLQLRLEAFNVFNHTNLQAPTDNLTLGTRNTAGFNAVNVGNAGIVTSTATTSRQVQLGAKIIF